ncbi:MAG: hypothetical protein AAFR12_22665 [Cyanobacteria bacterium J06626_6]
MGPVTVDTRSLMIEGAGMKEAGAITASRLVGGRSTSAKLIMKLELDFLPGTYGLLSGHEQAGQQPDNLCGPYWVSLLLQAYGKFSLSSVDVAKTASTLLPSQGNPSEWLPSGATSRRGEGYDTIPTGPNINECGTSVSGLIQAAEKLSEGRFCLLPLQTENWESGLNNIVQICHSFPELGLVPLLNIHTSYLWSSRVSPSNVVQFLQSGEEPSTSADWSVGHFALLIANLQGQVQKLYAILDTYPQFGWNGLHLQPPGAIAQSLHRPQQSTQGGILLFAPSKHSAQLQKALVQQGFHIAPWDNGTPFCPA